MSLIISVHGKLERIDIGKCSLNFRASVVRTEKETAAGVIRRCRAEVITRGTRDVVIYDMQRVAYCTMNSCRSYSIYNNIIYI